MKGKPSKLFALAVGAGIFVVMPLLLWGISDVGGFFRHPARVAYVVITMVAQVLVVVFLPNVGMGTEEGRKLVKRQRVAVTLLQIGTVGVVLVAPLTDRFGWTIPGGDAVRYTGAVLYAVGQVFMGWSVAHLGRLFSVQVTLQEGHHLVQDGPYRLIRHPRYLGIAVCFVGGALIFASFAALAIVAAVVAVLCWRIHDEEALMAGEFGAEWAAYCNRTKRLVPFVY